MSKVRDILGVDKESEFLQSFVRVGLTADQDDHEPHKSLYMQPKPHVTIAKQSSDNRSDFSDGKSPRRSRSSAPFDGGGQKGRRRRHYYEEMYTDKDRAAAVSYGYNIHATHSLLPCTDKTPFSLLRLHSYRKLWHKTESEHETASRSNRSTSVTRRDRSKHAVNAWAAWIQERQHRNCHFIHIEGKHNHFHSSQIKYNFIWMPFF